MNALEVVLKVQFARGWWLKKYGIRVLHVGGTVHVWRTSKRGYVYDYDQVVTGGLDFSTWWALVEGAVSMMALERRERGKDPRQPRVPTDPQFHARYPKLWQRLTDPLRADGSQRKLDTMSFSIDAGLWSMRLKDNADGFIMWTKAPTYLECLECCEERVDDPDEWREDDWFESGKPARKRKK